MMNRISQHVIQIIVCLTILGWGRTGWCLPKIRPEELQEEHRLSTQLETPHTDWAVPYAGGKTRVLFVMNIGYAGTVAREAVELKQRFDFEIDAVYWANIIDSPKYHWHGAEAGIARMKQLLQQKWDCYVFVGIPPAQMPVEAQYLLLNAVTSGAGIVMLGTEDARVLKPERQLELPLFLVRGLPLSGLKCISESPLKTTSPKAYRVKDGRGVWLPTSTPNIPYDRGWDTEYEYWSQFVGRAILWAAGREPKVAVEAVVHPASINWTGKPSGTISVKFSNTEGAKMLWFAISLRRYDGLRIHLPHARTSSAAGVLERALPLLRADRYFVDVIATSKEGVEGWTSTTFEVESPRGIREVTLQRSWGEVGDHLAGKAVLAGSATFGGEMVRLDLCDRRNRVLARCSLPVESNEVLFRFDVEEWMPMLVRVEATLLIGTRELANAYTYFNVTKRHRRRFNFVIWDVPQGALAPYAEESLARIGGTVHLDHGTPPRLVAAYDMAWIPYTTHISGRKDKNGYMTPTCWNNEAGVTRYVSDIVKPHGKSREHGVFVYSLGDEIVTRGSCLHPDCLQAFRAYLRKEYDTIQSLNASWGTEYQSFDEVDLSAIGDNDALEAKRQKNYSRWYDRQAFQCANFSRLCERFVKAFGELDPHARVGFEGAGQFDDGDDYDRIVRTNGFWSPYPGQGDEIIRSIAPREFVRSNWMGYSKDADSLLAKYWRMITRGNDSVWWWRWDGVGIFHGLLAPDLAPYAAIQELVADTQTVRDGLGTLLIHSEMQHDGIALLYSMPSAYATRVEQGPAYGSYRPTHEVWSVNLRELGLQYSYVTDRMLRLGEFAANKFRVLILPRAEAMDMKEADVIWDFVRRGGTVIADVRPGIYDGHCKPRKTGVLDDLFGVFRSDADTAPLRDKASLSYAGTRLDLTTAVCDPAVRLASGKAHGACGDTPLLISNSVGRGRAILFNFDMLNYPLLGAKATPEPAAEILSGLLRDAGVEPVFRVISPEGKRMRNLETIRWRNGDMELVALFRGSGESGEGRLLLPVPRYVYNLRDHTFLGKAREVNTRIIASRATFFAVTPQPLPSLQLALSRKSVEAGSVVQLRIQPSPPPTCLLAAKVSVVKPDGKTDAWMDTRLLVGNTGGNVSIPVAFNDPKGKWRIRVTNVCTNQTTEIACVVK